MKVTVVSPTKAYIDGSENELDELRRTLSYINTANQHLMKRHYNNNWFRAKNKDAWEARLLELKASVNKNLLYSDEKGHFIRPGYLPYLNIKSEDIDNRIQYPKFKKVSWAKPLTFSLYPYQEESWEKLLEAKHANVQISTGCGKSAIIQKVCRESGLRTAIVAPSKAIFNELVEKFELHLGRANVGKFGDGKKKLGKKFTVCIGDSLSNVRKDTPEWEFFSKLDMLIVDESHTWGAETLEDLCHGVFSEVPYRLFFSATQTRGDGAEKLLQSIIGKTVHSLNTSEAVAGGFICQHDFTVVEVQSSNPHYQSQDALDMKRAHLLKNKNIAQFVAKLANASATTHRRQTLVLVEELAQIAMLLPLLKVPTAIAHSESKPERLKELGISKVDPSESVDTFNRGDAMVLIGTSCIATGTNIFPTHQTINWVGGASEIKTKQGTVGRSVRLGQHNPYVKNCQPKPICHIFDFDVKDVYVLEKHLESRIEYYKESNTPIRRVRV